MSKDAIVEDAFEIYCERAYPDGMGDEQKAQVKNAFMAGVAIAVITFRHSVRMGRDGLGFINSMEDSLDRYKSE